MFTPVLSILNSPPQAHVLNLPIGHQASNNANDTVKIGDHKWQLRDKKIWKKWVRLMYLSCICKYFNMNSLFQIKRAIPLVLIITTIGFLVSYIIQSSGCKFIIL